MISYHRLGSPVRYEAWAVLKLIHVGRNSSIWGDMDLCTVHVTRGTPGWHWGFHPWRKLLVPRTGQRQLLKSPVTCLWLHSYVRWAWDLSKVSMECRMSGCTADSDAGVCSVIIHSACSFWENQHLVGLVRSIPSVLLLNHSVEPCKSKLLVGIWEYLNIIIYKDRNLSLGLRKVWWT